MLEATRGVVLAAAAVTTGLTAGLLYAYACSVMPALRRVDDRTFVEVMQRVNTAILNAWFAAAFVGAPVFIAVALVLEAVARDRTTVVPVALALVLHALALGITRTVNIPLNNGLDAAGPPGSVADPAAVRARFEGPWVRWNAVRAAAATAAFGSLCWALLVR